MNKLLMMACAAVLVTTTGLQAADQNEKTVFVTKASFESNMGGLSGADTKCQAEADDPASIVPSGTYMAWLSDGTNSPDTRFTKSSHPYVLPNGTRIADDYNDLTDGNIQNIINVDFSGKTIGQQNFWSSTAADGTSEQNFATCKGWTWTNTSGYSHSMLGITNKKSTLWTSFGREKCGKTYRLVCFQQ